LPLYEYLCDRDGRFEVIRKFSDPPLKKCPKCGGPIQRLPSAPAIQFKGTGWYVTDYAKKSGGEASKEGEGSKGKEADKGGKDAATSPASSDSSAGSSKGKSESVKSESGKNEGGKSESRKSETSAKAAGSGGKKGS
jgi:putative FmdB family regulatory protein